MHHWSIYLLVKSVYDANFTRFVSFYDAKKVVFISFYGANFIKLCIFVLENQ